MNDDLSWIEEHIQTTDEELSYIKQIIRKILSMDPIQYEKTLSDLRDIRQASKLYWSGYYCTSNFYAKRAAFVLNMEKLINAPCRLDEKIWASIDTVLYKGGYLK